MPRPLPRLDERLLLGRGHITSDQLLESVADDLDEARARIARARAAMERALEERDDPRAREAVARLGRMVADVGRLALIQAGPAAG